MSTPAFTEQQIAQLRNMVMSWVAEGFAVPPYSPTQYDIFEILELGEDVDGYDIKRPT